MRKKILIAATITILTVLCWLSLQFVFILGSLVFEKAVESITKERVVFVRRPNLESEPGVRVLDANNPFFQVQRYEPNGFNISWGQTSLNLKNRCRIKMLKEEGEKRVKVLGTLFNGKNYPIIIDSGFNQFILACDTIVLDADLEIYPMPELGDSAGGLCHLMLLKIGDLTIDHPLCFYTLQHYEGRQLGRTKWMEKQLLFGLGLLKQFRYILIDNVNQEVEFSVKDLFEPEDPNEWNQYPTSLEMDNSNRERLMVDIPLTGQTQHLLFDTGSGCGLIVAEDVWKSISSELKILKKVNVRQRMPHGFEPSEKITVQTLDVGNRCLKNATIYMLLNEEPCGKDFFLLGMGYFQDTIVVIDFERNLLWVKQTTDFAAKSENNS
jgi:hypothetical protein